MTENIVYKTNYDNIKSITLKQGNNEYYIDNIHDGLWSLLIYKVNHRGIYIFNPLLISQVYSDKKFDMFGKNIEIRFNKCKRFKNELYSEDKLKIYDNGILIKDNISIYPSAFYGDISGLLLLSD